MRAPCAGSEGNFARLHRALLEYLDRRERFLLKSCLPMTGLMELAAIVFAIPAVYQPKIRLGSIELGRHHTGRGCDRRSRKSRLLAWATGELVYDRSREAPVRGEAIPPAPDPGGPGCVRRAFYFTGAMT